MLAVSKMKIQMCTNCDYISRIFDDAKTDKHGKYALTIEQLVALKKSNKIEVLMADCDLDKAIEVLYSEMHYTVMHYFNCSECNRLHRIGACIRGTPLYENNIEIDLVKESKKLWGTTGKFYTKNV